MFNLLFSQNQNSFSYRFFGKLKWVYLLFLQKLIFLDKFSGNFGISMMRIYIFMKIVSTLLLGIAVLAVLGNASQDIDIPEEGYGFTIGDPYGRVHITFVIDLLCSDSKHEYGVWEQVLKQYPLHINDIKYTYQFNPLPYHYYAVKVTQGFYYILKEYGETRARDYMDYIFDNIQKYYEQENLDKTLNSFLNGFADEMFLKFGVDLVEFREALEIKGSYFQKVINNWKYVAGVLGAPGAPIFYANGVRIDGAENFSVSQWITFLKQFEPEEK